MPNYQRFFIPGATYFFTVVTYDRLPLLTTPIARQILHFAWEDVRKRFPFSTPAICLLPEHLHCMWTMPEGDADFSLRWREIKRIFSREYNKAAGTGEVLNLSRLKRGETAIWQRRFWEHTIRNERDFERHADYIHYNPVKHGLVENLEDWQWSSFHRYYKNGFYAVDWQQKLDQRFGGANFGE